MQVGALGTNCYIVSCKRTNEAMIIDPGGNTSDIVSYVHAKKLRIKAIVDTHGHADHIAANDDLRNLVDARLYIHEKDSAMLASAEKNLSLFIGRPLELRAADGFLKEGDTLTIGEHFRYLRLPDIRRAVSRFIQTKGRYSAAIRCFISLSDAAIFRAVR